MLENVAYSTDFFPNFKVFDENFAWLNRAGFKRVAKRGFMNMPLPPPLNVFIQKRKVKGRRKQFIFLTCLFNLNIGELDFISFDFLTLLLWNKVCRLFTLSSILNHYHITLFWTFHVEVIAKLNCTTLLRRLRIKHVFFKLILVFFLRKKPRNC